VYRNVAAVVPLPMPMVPLAIVAGPEAELGGADVGDAVEARARS